MDDISKGIQLYKENKFDQSAQYLNSQILRKDISKQDKIMSFEYLIKIYNILKKERLAGATEEQFVNYLIDHQLYIKGIDILRKILIKNRCLNKSKKLFQLWHMLKESGKVRDAKKSLKVLIEYLIKRKFSKQLNGVLDEYKKDYGEGEYYWSKYLEGAVIEGRWDLIDGYLKDLAIDNLDLSLSFEKSMNYVDRVINSYNLQMSKYGYISTYYLFNLFQKKIIKKSSTRGKIINIIYDGIVVQGVNKELLIALMNYIFIFKAYDLYFSDKYYLHIVKKLKFSQKKQLKFIELIESIEEMMVNERNEETTINFDAVGKLLSKETRGDKPLEIRKLERDIVFLKSVGKEEEAKIKIKRLAKYDSNNTIVGDFSNNIEFNEMLDPAGDIEIVLRDIDLLLDHGSDEKEKSDIELNELAFSKYIETLSQKTIIKSHNDIIVSLITSGLYQTSLKFLENIQNDTVINSNEKKDIELKYLKCLILFNTKKYYNVVQLVDDCLGNRPLMKAEMVAFLYLKAESLRITGITDEACIIYKRIKKLDDNYRLVRMRLEEIE